MLGPKPYTVISCWGLMHITSPLMEGKVKNVIQTLVDQLRSSQSCQRVEKSMRNWDICSPHRHAISGGMISELHGIVDVEPRARILYYNEGSLHPKHQFHGLEIDQFEYFWWNWNLSSFVFHPILCLEHPWGQPVMAAPRGITSTEHLTTLTADRYPTGSCKLFDIL